MLFITIIILIVAKALPVLNTQITSSQFSRLTSLSLIFSGLICLNSLYLESIGSGIGIYSGLFHITQITQIFEIFIYFIGAIILMGWYQPQISLIFSPLTFLPSPTSQKGEVGEEGGSEGRVNENRIYPLFSVAPQHANAVNGYIKDYSLIILFTILGSSLLITSFDLISIYLSIELQSFGLYVLSTLYKNSESSTSSGLKYFLLGGLSSCIILLGIGLIYSYTGITNLESLYLLNTVSTPSGDLAVQGLSIGLILLFVGFLFKIAAAPLHNWSPDVYDGTPTIVTSWLTIVPKISILILLLELQFQLGSADAIFGAIKTYVVFLSNTGYLLNYNVLQVPLALAGEGSVNFNISAAAASAVDSSNTTIAYAPAIKTLLLISSVLSLIVGSLLGLAQIRIKRLLAYSTISHIGFLLLALAINTEQSIDSFLFYLLQYTMTNLNIFLIILAFSYLPLLRQNYSSDGAGITIKDIRHISEFKGLFYSNPLLSLCLAISLFSMAGIPPLLGFFSKQFVLYSAVQNGYYFISILAIIVSVISASYYLKIVKVLLDEPRDNNLKVNVIFPLPLSFASPIFTAWRGPALVFNPVPESYGNLGQRAKAVVQGNTRQNNTVELSNIHSYIISTLTLIILLFFIKPSIILNSTKLLTLSLFSI